MLDDKEPNQEPPAKKAKKSDSLSVPQKSKKSTPVSVAKNKPQQEGKENQEKKGIRKFQEAWKKEFPWVEHDPEKDIMYCTLCRAYPNIADRTASLYKGCGTGGKYKKETIEKHSTSTKHQLCETRRQNETAPQNAPMQKAVTKLSKENESRMNALFTMAFFIAEEKMAFKKFPRMCLLQEKLGTDIGTMYRNEKACKAFVKSIAEVECQNLTEELQNARFFTVLADGSTDSAIMEQESVYTFRQ